MTDLLEERTRYYIELAQEELTLAQRLSGVGTLSKEDAQLAHRSHFQTTEHALLGTVFVESTGYRFEQAVPRVGKVPSLGGDGERVRALLAGRATGSNKSI